MQQVQKLHYHRQRKLLDVLFRDDVMAQFTAEFLRVLSPSAEVRGHGTARLVANKRDVAIQQMLPVGQYAVKLLFDDGHESGIYSWSYLRQLHDNAETLWQDYLQRLQAANAVRDPKLAVKLSFS